jgi:hypothetical protein
MHSLSYDPKAPLGCSDNNSLAPQEFNAIGLNSIAKEHTTAIHLTHNLQVLPRQD